MRSKDPFSLVRAAGHAAQAVAAAVKGEAAEAVDKAGDTLKEIAS